ncbi:hypothetical protein Sjap_022098 [Stephania japonica]|uniref:Uncharacterized protein n=1 Tax=Stephania japonica TaxID=461633 RepID=A0AAP0HU40_9MAGN
MLILTRKKWWTRMLILTTKKWCMLILTDDEEMVDTNIDDENEEMVDADIDDEDEEMVDANIDDEEMVNFEVWDGVSLKTQELYGMVLLARYLDLCGGHQAISHGIDLKLQPKQDDLLQKRRPVLVKEMVDGDANIDDEEMVEGDANIDDDEEMVGHET